MQRKIGSGGGEKGKREGEKKGDRRRREREGEEKRSRRGGRRGNAILLSEQLQFLRNRKGERSLAQFLILPVSFWG